MRNESGAFGADDNEMRESLDLVTAERLLDGTGKTPPALADLLARAAAAPRANELAGEAAALAAFRVAPALVRPAHARPTRSRRRWLIAAAAAGLTFASAGVAVAAATGVLPNPLRAPSASTPGPSSDAPSLAAPPSGGRGSGEPGSAASAPPPDAAVLGLCRAYLAQLAAGDEDGLRNPRFAALLELAGGADQVLAYCAERGVVPSPEPTHGRSDGHPSGPPATPGPQTNNQPAR